VSILILKGPVFNGTELCADSVVVADASSGKITNVGRIGEIDEPRGAQVITVNDGTILPGLIDAHLHFFGTQKHALMDWNVVPETLVALRSVADMGRLLRAGFTAVRDLGSKAGTYLSQAEREGMILGPRIISAAKSLSQTGGDDDPTLLPLQVAQELSYSYYCDGPWECRKAVRKVLRDGAEVVKVYASGSFAQGGKVRPQFTVEELRAIVDEAHSAGLRVAAHAYGEGAMRNVVEAEVDSIEHGIGLTPEIAKAIKNKGIFYVPTLSIYLSPNPNRSKESAALVERHCTQDIRLAKEFGLKIVAGSDYTGDTLRHGENYREIVSLAGVIGKREALVAATATAAECLGIESGRIEKGYDADIVVVRGNPLDDIEALSPKNILQVVRRGAVCALEPSS
jgi:imidazolonepropionase-like amidohydrolase